MLNDSLYVLLYRIPCAGKGGQGCLCMSGLRIMYKTVKSLAHSTMKKNVSVNIENIALSYRRKDILLHCPLYLSM